jgi:hypothetical protein
VTAKLAGVQLSIAPGAARPGADEARAALRELLDVPLGLHEADGGVTIVCLDEFPRPARPARKRKTVRLTLNRTGRQLLAKNHELKVAAQITERGHRTRTLKITFKANRPKR